MTAKVSFAVNYRAMRRNLLLILIIFLIIFLILIPSPLIYRMFFTTTPALSLAFPDDKLLTAPFSLTIAHDGVASNISGTLHGRPRLLHNGISYRCLLNNCTIIDDNGYIVIEYQCNDANDHLYRTDSRWSDKERQDKYNAFSIDITSNSPSDDTSLFQHPVDFFITTDGRITEITLPPPLQTALSTTIAGKEINLLLTELLTNSAHIPPLFSPKTSTNSWKTTGTFLTPIAFLHTITNIDDNTIHIKTRSTSNDNVTQNSTFYHILSLYNRTITDHLWEIDWTYNNTSHTIPSLDISLFLCLSSYCLGNTSTTSYSCTLSLTTSFAPLPPTIANAPLF